MGLQGFVLVGWRHKTGSFLTHSVHSRTTPRYATVPPVNFWLAALALRHREAIVERNLTIIRENLQTLGSFFAAHQDAFVWDQPKAGPIAFPRYLGESVERFCTELLQGTGVLLAPGTVYGYDYNYFRVGFGRRNMPEGLQKLEQFLADNSGNLN